MKLYAHLIGGAGHHQHVLVLKWERQFFLPVHKVTNAIPLSSEAYQTNRDQYEELIYELMWRTYDKKELPFFVWSGMEEGKAIALILDYLQQGRTDLIKKYLDYLQQGRTDLIKKQMKELFLTGLYVNGHATDD